MKPFRRLGEAMTPDGTVLALFEHDGAYVIRVNGVELMSTRRHHSEDALAELACRPLQERPDAHVLIGGLGLGFTLKAALRLLASDARVVVAEIVETVIEWNRNPDYPLAADALRDPRVEVLHEDVVRVLQQHPGGFDAIMLDVDNGADPLTTSGNAQLYGPTGIHLAVAALRPAGRLVYWSAGDDRSFEKSLRHAGLTVTVSHVRAHATSGPKHTLYVGQVNATATRRTERTRPG
jgi:spermidine synthase